MQCKSERVREIQTRVAVIKSSEEIGVKYMHVWEEKVLEQQRAREEERQRAIHIFISGFWKRIFLNSDA